MKAIFRCYAIALVAIFSFSIPAFAQYYPMPGSTSEPAVICNGCATDSTPATGLPTYPYSHPITRHVGRYIDSTVAPSKQQPIRTYRAGTIKIAEAQDRIYMQIGSTFASYRLSTWFTQNLGQPMDTLVSVSGVRTPEKFLPFLAQVYPEANGSGWKTVNVDSQDRLGPLFDWDDRGYVYLAYTFFGWGIVQDNGSQLKLIKQTGGPVGPPDGGTDVTPELITVLKAGASYYAVVFSASKAAVYDVTTPTSPQFVRKFDIGVAWFAKAQLGNETAFGIVDRYGRVEIYSASDFLNGGSPKVAIAPSSGTKFGGIDSDGTNFYAAEGALNKTANLVAIRPSGGGISTYAATRYPIGNSFQIESVSYGSDSVTVTGFDGTADNLRVFKLTSGAPDEINFGNFFRSYYAGVKINGVWTHAAPSFATQLNAGMHYKWQGKEYVIAGVNGLGDVYEIQGRDSVEVKLNAAAGWGPKNPSSTRMNDGPFYGDALSFTTGSTGEAALVTVNFGNPEAGAGSNSPSPFMTGQNLNYRYSGLTTDAAISTTKKVRVTDTGDATNYSEANVQMLVPVPRVGIAGTSLLFTQPAQSATAPIVAGDNFVDASDGTVGSHFSTWTIDGVPTPAVPTTPIPVGQCGLHTLGFSARYGDYNATTFVGNAAADYTRGFQIGYEVRPFATSFKVSSSTTASVTFVSANRASSTAVVPGTWVMYTWTLKSPTGVEVLREETPDMLQPAAARTFTVPRELLTSGSVVKLTVTMDAAGISEPSCVQYTSAAAETLVLVPDPVLTVQGCGNVGSPCSITAASAAGQDTSGWKYTWYLDNVKKSGVSGNIYTPAASDINAVKSYEVRVEVQNGVGIDASSPTKTFALEPSLCSEPPGANINFGYLGANTGCTSLTPCTNAEPITFVPNGWGYAFQNCDQFLWNFDDGTTSTDRAPLHVFPTNNKTYNVKLTVTNTLGNRNVQLAVTLGTIEQPPPPPPPPPSGCSPPGGVFAAFSGPSGCSSAPSSPACKTNETISFSITTWGYTIQPCDKFLWTFPDGSTSLQQNPTKKFTTAGTHYVTLKVSNTAGSKDGSVNVVVEGSGGEPPPPPPGCAAPSGLVFVDYSGATSGCSNAPDAVSGCLPGETITLLATKWNGAFQSCDQFEWNFGDGSAAQTTTAPSVTHVFQGGLPAYGVAVKVKNSAGSMDSGVDISFAQTGVEKPTNVEIEIGAGSPFIGVAMTFRAKASAPESHPVSVWSWKFSDGGTASGPEVQHTFTAEGPAWAEVSAANAGGATAPVRKNFNILGASSFAFVIPVAAHSAGSGGSSWRTDVQIFNPGGLDEPLELRFEFPATGHVRTIPIASSTKVYEDVVLELFGISGDSAGPIRISGAGLHVPSIWSRTYNQNSNGIGTYGQYIPAVRIDTAGNATVANTKYYLTGLQSSPGYRTNVGWVNLTGSALDLQITAYGENGSALGTIQKTAMPFQLNQTAMTALIPETANAGVVTIRIDGGRTGELIAYGSIVDNISQDPVYISAVPDVIMGDAKHAEQVIPGVGHLTNGNWRSDVDIFNPDGEKATIDLMFYDAAGNKLAEALNVNLEAKHTLHLSDVTHSGQLTPVPTSDTLGVLKIRTNVSALTERFPIVVDRTYSDRGASGTFGQGIAATPITQSNVEAGKPAIIPGVRGDQDYYTNFGLVALSDAPTLVRVSLLSIESGTVQGTFEYMLDTDPGSTAPESLIDSGTGGQTCGERGVVRRLHGTAAGGALKVEVLSGGPVWAYASMVDCKTSDPEYIPASPLE